MGVQVLPSLDSPEASERDEDSEDEAMTAEAREMALPRSPGQEESSLPARSNPKSLRTGPILKDDLTKMGVVVGHADDCGLPENGCNHWPSTPPTCLTWTPTWLFSRREEPLWH